MDIRMILNELRISNFELRMKNRGIPPAFSILHSKFEIPNSWASHELKKETPFEEAPFHHDAGWINDPVLRAHRRWSGKEEARNPSPAAGVEVEVTNVQRAEAASRAAWY